MQFLEAVANLPLWAKSCSSGRVFKPPVPGTPLPVADNVIVWAANPLLFRTLNDVTATFAQANMLPLNVDRFIEFLPHVAEPPEDPQNRDFLLEAPTGLTRQTAGNLFLLPAPLLAG